MVSKHSELGIREGHHEPEDMCSAVRRNILAHTGRDQGVGHCCFRVPSFALPLRHLERQDRNPSARIACSMPQLCVILMS